MGQSDLGSPSTPGNSKQTHNWLLVYYYQENVSHVLQFFINQQCALMQSTCNIPAKMIDGGVNNS